MKKLLSIIFAVLIIATSIPFASAASTIITSEEELIAALESGGEYVFGADITLTDIIKVESDATVVIDMRAFTIRSSDDTDSSQKCLWIGGKNNVTFSNGNVENVTLYVTDYAAVVLKNLNMYCDYTTLNYYEAIISNSKVYIYDTNIEADEIITPYSDAVIYSGTFNQDVSEYIDTYSRIDKKNGKYIVAHDYGKYRITVTFKVHERSSENKTYTGPEFDTNGMGFTLYYSNSDSLAKDSMTKEVYCLSENRYEDGNLVSVEFQSTEIPRYVEYYCEGSLLNPNNWSLYSVSVNEVTVWDGEIRCKGKGIDSNIMLLDLKAGTTSVQSEAELSEWIKNETKHSQFYEPKDVEKLMLLEESDEVDIIVKDGEAYQKVSYMILNAYNGAFYKQCWFDINCSESIQGIEVLEADNTFYHEETSTISFSNHHYEETGIYGPYAYTFTIKISDPEWTKNKFNISLYIKEGVEYPFFTMNVTACKTFTLNASGGQFADGSTTTEIQKVYNSTLGSMPLPHREGYSFKGFYLTEDTDHTDDIVPDTEKLSPKTLLTENKTWYASWSLKSYKATYSYLDENAEQKEAEFTYKYGEEYSAFDEIPTVVKSDGVKYTFTGWSPDFTGTKIMGAQNVTYEAQYTESPDYADYTKLDEAVIRANEILKDEEYALRYTETSRNNLDAAVAAVEYGLLASEQSQVDAFTENLNNAVANMVMNKYSVEFIDNDGKIIFSVDAEYGSKVDVPVMPSVKFCDESEHYVFSGWDESTDGCEYVTKDMQFTATYDKEAHSFTTYIVDAQASADGNKTLVSQCDMGCGATDTVVIVGSSGEHKDEDGDGVCDNDCDHESEPPAEPETGVCEDCGKDHSNPLYRIFCFITQFFLRLLRSFGF